jgi:signal transduction histidine kinase|tara:strand:- start:317 stop:589 length:273 start_codon:yes stop_codon:yes gene_type:complete
MSKINNEREARWLVRDYLEAVSNGDYILYNSVAKEFVEVTESRMENMIDQLVEDLAGHGIKHLQFIHHEYAKIKFKYDLQEAFNKYIKGR